MQYVCPFTNLQCVYGSYNCPANENPSMPMMRAEDALISYENLYVTFTTVPVAEIKD